MDYRGEKDPEKQGRLDKFLNLGYSGAAGLESDEFGYKGLGSKLMYLSRKLEIITKTVKGDCYKVEIHNPMEKLLKKKPELPKPLVYRLPSEALNIDHGTIIRVYGYDGGKKYPEYTDLEKLKKYLYYRTLVGCTKEDRLKLGFPRILIKIPDMHEYEEIKLGFPWIKKTESNVEGQKIGIIDPPIKVTKSDGHENSVTVVLKGGYALKTGEFGMSDYGMLQSLGVGLIYSWRGIPLFNLDFNRYKPDGFELYYRFCRFVVECDDVETDIARSRIVADGIKEPLFTKALREAFRRITETQDYKEWVDYRRRLKRKELAATLNERKAVLENPQLNWVYYKGDLIHKEPDNENDVLALLWKLEALKAIPFYYFRTLEHTARKGIDIIAEYQETEESERKLYQAIEVEYMLENYMKHEHVAEQTSLIIAWDAKKINKLDKIKGNWKYVWNYRGHDILVILLKYLPDIEIRKKRYPNY